MECRSISGRVHHADDALDHAGHGSVHPKDYWIRSPRWKCRWSNALPYVQRCHFWSGLATAYLHRQRSAFSIPSMESQHQGSGNRGGEVTATCTDVSSVCEKADRQCSARATGSDLHPDTADLANKLRTYQAYYNEHRCHSGRDGATPADSKPGNVIDLRNYHWEKHCRGLFLLPVAV